MPECRQNHSEASQAFANLGFGSGDKDTYCSLPCVLCEREAVPTGVCGLEPSLASHSIDVVLVSTLLMRTALQRFSSHRLPTSGASHH